MTRVNVDDVAFMDRRFKLLGGRLGISWQEALGRCLPVWALAYSRRSAVLPPVDIDALAERSGFANAMLEVELGIEHSEGIYLAGVSDRIEFLLVQDAKRQKARQAKLAAVGVVPPRRPSRGTKTDVKVPGDYAGGDSPGPSPGTLPQEGPYSLDLDLDPGIPPLSPGTVPRENKKEPVPSGSQADKDRTELRQRLIWAAWKAGGEEFLAVKAAGIDPDAVNSWSGMPSSDSPPMANLKAIVDSLLTELHDYDLVLEKITRRIKVAGVEARTKHRHAMYMTPSRIWNRDSFSIGSELTPGQAARQSTKASNDQKIRPGFNYDEPPQPGWKATKP